MKKPSPDNVLLKAIEKLRVTVYEFHNEEDLPVEVKRAIKRSFSDLMYKMMFKIKRKSKQDEAHVLIYALPSYPRDEFFESKQV